MPPTPVTIMTFEKSDVIASVMGSRGTEGRNGLIEVAGENGQLVADHAHNYLYVIRGMEREMTWTAIHGVALGLSPFLLQPSQAFVDDHRLIDGADANLRALTTWSDQFIS